VCVHRLVGASSFTRTAHRRHLNVYLYAPRLHEWCASLWADYNRTCVAAAHMCTGLGAGRFGGASSDGQTKHLVNKGLAKTSSYRCVHLPDPAAPAFVDDGLLHHLTQSNIYSLNKHEKHRKLVKCDDKSHGQHNGCQSNTKSPIHLQNEGHKQIPKIYKNIDVRIFSHITNQNTD